MKKIIKINDSIYNLVYSLYKNLWNSNMPVCCHFPASDASQIQTLAESVDDTARAWTTPCQTLLVRPDAGQWSDTQNRHDGKNGEVEKKNDKPKTKERNQNENG